MNSQEFEGKNIDEAIGKACAAFNVPREKLSIDILADGNSGFLGIMGQKKARISACLLSLEEAFTSQAPESPLPSTPPPEAPPRETALRKTPLQESNLRVDTGDKRPAPLQAVKSDDSTAEKAKSLLEGILARMNLTCPVTVTENSDKIILNIQGDGGGLLIGKRGQNLDALQYIVNKAVHKSSNGRKMIVVDTESYRQRREESLLALAAKLGEKVKKTKKAVTLSYLNAHNRRIIHMALQNDASLSTKSRGEGEYRKIIIVPVKKE